LSQSPGWSARAQNEREVPYGEATALLAALRRLAEHDGPAQPVEQGPARPSITLADAYRHCVGITRKHSRSFFLSSQLLPAEKRLAIRALYAFCRTSDDLVDQPDQDATQALAAWVAQVHAPSPPADNAVLLAWHDTLERYHVPRSLPDELLAGIAMDLTVSRYATFDDLWLYCYRVASVVGLISMHIIGYREGASPFAIKLGVALQLTNILRDVGEDALTRRTTRGCAPIELDARPRVHLCVRDPRANERGARSAQRETEQCQRAHVSAEATSVPGHEDA